MPEPSRILVVDDHEEMAFLLAERMRDDGLIVDTATDGQEALALVRLHDHDLVLTDLRLGSFDGLDLLDAIRADDPERPVILITAFGAVDTAVEAMRPGGPPLPHQALPLA